MPRPRRRHVACGSDGLNGGCRYRSSPGGARARPGLLFSQEKEKTSPKFSKMKKSNLQIVGWRGSAIVLLQLKPASLQPGSAACFLQNVVTISCSFAAPLVQEKRVVWPAGRHAFDCEVSALCLETAVVAQVIGPRLMVWSRIANDCHVNAMHLCDAAA